MLRGRVWLGVCGGVEKNDAKPARTGCCRGGFAWEVVVGGEGWGETRPYRGIWGGTRPYVWGDDTPGIFRKSP